MNRQWCWLVAAVSLVVAGANLGRADDGKKMIVCGRAVITVGDQAKTGAEQIRSGIKVIFVAVKSDAPVDVAKLKPEERVEAVASDSGLFCTDKIAADKNYQIRRLEAKYHGQAIALNPAYIIDGGKALPADTAAVPVFWHALTTPYSPTKGFSGLSRVTTEFTDADAREVKAFLQK
jgi:hypothetical protein